MKKATILTTVIVVLCGCSTADKLSPENMAANACDCFNKLENGMVDQN